MALFVSIPLLYPVRLGTLSTLAILYFLYILSVSVQWTLSLWPTAAQFLTTLREKQGIRLGLAIRHLIELVADSIRPILIQNGGNRVVVYGKESQRCASYLSSSKEFPSRVFALQGPNSAETNGVFWVDELTDLPTSLPLVDAILWSNVCPESESELIVTVKKMSALLRDGACLAGCGIFQDTSSRKKSGSGGVESGGELLDLKSFRNILERCGFDVHTAIDLSLEGQSLFVIDQIKDSGLIPRRFVGSNLIHARFLATNTQTSLSTPLTLPLEIIRPFESDTKEESDLKTNTKTKKTSQESIVVSGVSLGLPNHLYPDVPVFSKANFDRVFMGQNFISNLSEEDKQSILDQKPFMVFKKNGLRVDHKLEKDSEVLQLASKIGKFDLCGEYGVPPFVAEALDTTYQLAIAAGLEALSDANILVTETTMEPGTDGRKKIIGLPKHMQEETGIIFASSFPALDSILEESKKFHTDKDKKSDKASYTYNRKLLFKVLVMANAQLAELLHAKGPNMQINTACSGTTEAISLAEDWIRVGRCRRVLVIAADNPTSPNLLPYLGTGFLTLGAATICSKVDDAAVPFDNRRKGMILGAGAVGLVIESLSTATQRGGSPKVEILGTRIANSAYHASMMDYEHISTHLGLFLKEIESKHGITKQALARESLYFSHETCTSICAKTELDALSRAFGESRGDLLITNTKAMTGHAMGVGMEDVIAVESLHVGKVPPVLNYKERDPSLGDLTLALVPESSESQTISHSRPYALRFAAGFGSHFGFILFRKYTKP